jgi:hypothetical protein
VVLSQCELDYLRSRSDHNQDEIVGEHRRSTRLIVGRW